MKKKQSAASTTGGSRRRNAPITMQMRRRCYEEEERKKKESKLKQGSGVCVGACRHRLSFAPLSSVRPAQRRKGRALFSSFFISSSTFFLFIEFPSLFSPRQHTQKQNRKFRHTHSLFFFSFFLPDPVPFVFSSHLVVICYTAMQSIPTEK